MQGVPAWLQFAALATTVVLALITAVVTPLVGVWVTRSNARYTLVADHAKAAATEARAAAADVAGVKRAVVDEVAGIRRVVRNSALDSVEKLEAVAAKVDAVNDAVAANTVETTETRVMVNGVHGVALEDLALALEQLAAARPTPRNVERAEKAARDLAEHRAKQHVIDDSRAAAASHAKET